MSSITLSQIAFATSSTDPNIYAWNIYTGTLLKTYKTNISSQNSSCLLRQDAFHCALISCQAESSILSHWSNLGKELASGKSILNQKFTSFSASNEAKLVAGGTVEGNLLIWNVENGDLLVNFAAHFSSIKVIRFTADSRCLLSASDDGSVSIWSLESLIASGSLAKKNSPLHCWIDHASCVNDVFVSQDSSLNLRILTASKDSFCHYYAFSSAAAVEGKSNKICSFKLPTEATACVMDANERVIFIGSGTGEIYPISCLDSSIQISSVIVSEQANSNTMNHHSQRVNSLSISPDNLCLLAASQDSTISCWSTETRQLLRVISFVKGPVTNVFTSLLPLSLECSFSQAIPMLKRSISLQEEEGIIECLNGSDDTSIMLSCSPFSESSLEKFVTLQQEYAHLNAMYEELYELANAK